MTTIEIALLVIVSILIFTCLFLYGRRAVKQEREVAVLKERLESRQEEIRLLKEDISGRESDREELFESSVRYREQVSQLQTQLQHETKEGKEKLELLNNAREKMTLEFKNIANEILEDKSRKFTTSNKENIEQILKPLNEKISQFEKKVEDTYDRESKERFSLAREIKNLQELNTRIGEDAMNLTNALKGESKTQGTWGEMILETILEKSGLVKGREYEVQVSLKSQEGARSQPDVIVNLPEGKHVIVDAKVSLTAYERYCASDDSNEKEEFLKQHLHSIRTHIKTLSAKEYQNLVNINSLDYVLLFMPVEAAFSLASQEDSELFTSAFKKNIVLVTPSTLLATLRIIQNIWRFDQQNKNALEIANRAGALYDKFVAFVVDLEDVGNKIVATQKSFEKANNKLHSGRGNLISRTEKLKALGARTSKNHQAQILSLAQSEESEDSEESAP